MRQGCVPPKLRARGSPSPGHNRLSSLLPAMCTDVQPQLSTGESFGYGCRFLSYRPIGSVLLEGRSLSSVISSPCKENTLHFDWEDSPIHLEKVWNNSDRSHFPYHREDGGILSSFPAQGLLWQQLSSWAQQWIPPECSVQGDDPSLRSKVLVMAQLQDSQVLILTRSEDTG